MDELFKSIIVSILVFFIHSQRYCKEDSILNTFLKIFYSHMAPAEFKKIINPVGQLATVILLFILGYFILAGDKGATK